MALCLLRLPCVLVETTQAAALPLAALAGRLLNRSTHCSRLKAALEFRLSAASPTRSLVMNFGRTTRMPAMTFRELESFLRCVALPPFKLGVRTRLIE